VSGLRRHSGTLYTVLAELYSNALEHGVLRLDSSLKTSAEGFSQYYKLREQRLSELDSGFIRIHLVHRRTAEGGTLRVRVEDSGPGFDAGGQADTLQEKNGNYYGRGLALLEKLCDSVNYLGHGNEVEVVFSWSYDA
jgi:anti-sigma regulatory factor (Ser/Thr protein kinase)